jgi:hypothetical protein
VGRATQRSRISCLPSMSAETRPGNPFRWLQRACTGESGYPSLIFARPSKDESCNILEVAALCVSAPMPCLATPYHAEPCPAMPWRAAPFSSASRHRNAAQAMIKDLSWGGDPGQIALIVRGVSRCPNWPGLPRPWPWCARRSGWLAAAWNMVMQALGDPSRCALGTCRTVRPAAA